MSSSMFHQTMRMKQIDIARTIVDHVEHELNQSPSLFIPNEELEELVRQLATAQAAISHAIEWSEKPGQQTP